MAPGCLRGKGTTRSRPRQGGGIPFMTERRKPVPGWLGLLLGLALGACAAPDAFSAQAAPASCSVKQTMRRFGFSGPVVRGRQIVLNNKWHSLVFEANGRKCLYDGTVVWLTAPVFSDGGEWRLSRADVDKVLSPLFAPSAALARAGYSRIVIDAGHGGDDHGAVGRRRGSREKSVNLDIARRVRSMLSPHLDVFMLRTDDRTLSLEARAARAAKLKPDIFISIHQNSATDRNASGAETHVIPPAGRPITASSEVTARDRAFYMGNRSDSANTCLGYRIQQSLVKATGAGDRGLRRSRFYVIRNMPCPAALIECGFLSNAEEEKKLRTREYKDKVARGIADGILAYVGAVKRARVSDSK